MRGSTTTVRTDIPCSFSLLSSPRAVRRYQADFSGAWGLVLSLLAPSSNLKLEKVRSSLTRFSRIPQAPIEPYTNAHTLYEIGSNLHVMSMDIPSLF